MSRNRHLSLLLSTCFLCLSCPLAAQVASNAAPRGGADDGIEMTFLNAVYKDLDGGLEPITQGPLTIRFSSPEHRLEVFRNRLWLRPAANGRIAVAAEVEFEGGGQLLADIEGAGVVQRFEDLVNAPRQTVFAQGEVTIDRQDDGYLFTVASRDGFVRVDVESGFAQQIQSLCGAMALMPMFSIDCAPLASALTRVGVPLPPEGTRMFLPSAWLTAEERQYLDTVLTP